MAPDLVPFVIGMGGTALRGNAETYRDRFASQRAILVPNAIEPEFLAKLQRLCNSGRFVPDSVVGLGDREVELPQRAGRAITLALRRPELTRWMEAATGSGTLVKVDGRVVQARPNDHDQLDWHDDLHDPQRRLAVTINLTQTPYEGGMFELRDKRTRMLLVRHQHVAPGTMLVFDVAPDLEHRVLPVIAGGPRRIYSGWFFKAAA